MHTTIYQLLAIGVFVLMGCFSSHSQQHFQQLDSVFAPWDSPNHPGGAIMVVQNNTTIFSKAYGLASLEYDIPNTTKTRFNIGSISKQFTAMGIVLLEQQHKLSFDDDIRKYLVELPDFGETITIRHLLHHTSGLRDLHGLLALAGWRATDIATNEDLYRVLQNQKDLNFKPGEEFLYCNTGYILLAKIIERVTNSSFPTWMKNTIFDPLGMQNTYVAAKPDRIVTNNATSYNGNNPFRRAIEHWGYYGSGNIYSTTADLMLWLQNFIHPKKEWSDAFSTLVTTTPLHNGYQTNYGFGVRIEEHLGKKMIQHGGAVGGYRAVARVYPEEHVQIVILTNFSNSGMGSKLNAITNIIFDTEESTVITTPKTQQSTNYATLSNQQLSKFEGIYWSDEEKYGRKIYIKKDRLRYETPSGVAYPLVPINASTFQLINVGEYVLLHFETANKVPKITVSIPNQIPGSLTLHQTIASDNSTDPRAYIGAYYSPELKTTYTILQEQTEVYCEHIRHGKIKLKRVFDDIYAGTWPVDTVEIKRDANSNVIGMKISNGRTRNVWFRKID
ncbi:serine hydrolase domain-containing protein [Aquimarina brevivitae]|uniref:CubicO group peptidase (Beta-lactamase class C family) n=1 Tax=Aquimarina brevivitae TaxID=323412 RepID=A0A4V2F5T5_9FLAO|nr:serine hydrolase domain-containing protein [Aquimarina brevivitae]RZS93939.1 CubicO group peptidase (beta-lactamase class C family) [Aquimarina brevivitae]